MPSVRQQSSGMHSGNAHNCHNSTEWESGTGESSISTEGKRRRFAIVVSSLAAAALPLICFWRALFSSFFFSVAYQWLAHTHSHSLMPVSGCRVCWRIIITWCPVTLGPVHNHKTLLFSVSVVRFTATLLTAAMSRLAAVHHHSPFHSETRCSWSKLDMIVSFSSSSALFLSCSDKRLTHLLMHQFM